MAKIVFGCGYLGTRVARRWQEAGEVVYAVTRKADRVATFEEQGWKPIVADVCDPNSLIDLPEVDTLVYSVGFDRSSGRDILDVYAGGFENVLDALPGMPRRIIYVSSTGVYNHSGGVWVDESSVCEPRRPGGKASLAAEEVLRNHARVPEGAGVVLRMAGLYGPNRVPYLAKIKGGEPVAVNPDSYLNLIHIEDAAAVVVACSQQKVLPSALYNVVDENPCRRGEFYGAVAKLLGAAEPVYCEPAADSPVAQRSASSKRISCKKLLSELGISLEYRSCHEGLAASLLEA